MSIILMVGGYVLAVGQILNLPGAGTPTKSWKEAVQKLLHRGSRPHQKFSIRVTMQNLKPPDSSTVLSAS